MICRMEFAAQKRRHMGITPVLIAAVSFWFFVNWDRASLRYKLTYLVDVNGETRTGSGVIEIRAEDTSKLPLLGRGFGSSATGEAVVVDFGNGRYVFSLLNNAATLPFKPFIKNLGNNKTGIDVLRELRNEKPKIELQFDIMPTLVTFINMENPKSIKRIDPANFQDTFGPGVRLLSVTLEVTDEQVTRGQVQTLAGWIDWSNDRWIRLSTDDRLPMRIKLSDGKTQYISRKLFKSGD